MQIQWTSVAVGAACEMKSRVAAERKTETMEIEGWTDGWMDYFSLCESAGATLPAEQVTPHRRRSPNISHLSPLLPLLLIFLHPHHLLLSPLQPKPTPPPPSLRLADPPASVSSVRHPSQWRTPVTLTEGDIICDITGPWRSILKYHRNQ